MGVSLNWKNVLLAQCNEANQHGASRDFVCRYARAPHDLPQGVFRNHGGRAFIESIRQLDLRLCIVKFENLTGLRATCDLSSADIWQQRFELQNTEKLKDFVIQTGVPALRERIAASMTELDATPLERLAASRALSERSLLIQALTMFETAGGFVGSEARVLQMRLQIPLVGAPLPVAVAKPPPPPRREERRDGVEHSPLITPEPAFKAPPWPRPISVVRAPVPTRYATPGRTTLGDNGEVSNQELPGAQLREYEPGHQPQSVSCASALNSTSQPGDEPRLGKEHTSRSFHH